MPYCQHRLLCGAARVNADQYPHTPLTHTGVPRMRPPHGRGLPADLSCGLLYISCKYPPALGCNGVTDFSFYLFNFLLAPYYCTIGWYTAGYTHYLMFLQVIQYLAAAFYTWAHLWVCSCSAQYLMRWINHRGRTEVFDLLFNQALGIGVWDYLGRRVPLLDLWGQITCLPLR